MSEYSEKWLQKYCRQTVREIRDALHPYQGDVDHSVSLEPVEIVHEVMNTHPETTVTLFRWDPQWGWTYRRQGSSVQFNMMDDYPLGETPDPALVGERAKTAVERSLIGAPSHGAEIEDNVAFAGTIRLRNAILEVNWLHQPEYSLPQGEWVCGVCMDASENQVSYPCATVSSIARMISGSSEH